MNSNDHDKEKRLDEFINALNAGDVLPDSTNDDELAGLFATARDVSRLRVAASQPPDVPTRLAAALERELRAGAVHDAVGPDARMLPLPDFTATSTTGRNQEMQPSDHVEPRHPRRLRQWAQFAAAAFAFILVGVVLAQVLGGGDDDSGGAVGTDADAIETMQVVVPSETASAITPTPTLPATHVQPTPSQSPTVDAPDGLPTPDASGAYRLSTFDEARALTPFKLVEPASVPPGLTFEGLLLYTELDMSTPDAFKAGPVDMVTAYYEHDQSGGFQFTQTTRGCTTTEESLEEVVIAGKTVHRFIGTNQSGDPLGHYRWQTGEICYIVIGLLDGGIDQELLDSFVAVTLSSDSGADSFPPSYPILSVSPDYVTCEDTVTAHGANFEPGTTITIYGGQLVGDSFAPIVVEHPVADDGTFEVELNLLRLISDCALGVEVTEGSQFLLSAETGSALVKDGVVEQRPSAMTVLTFSLDVSTIVRDRERLQHCGVEVMLNVTMLREESEPDREARECFAAAVEAGAIAEFISIQETVEGDIITTIYNSLGNQDVDVIVDGTRDRFGSGVWQRGTCVWNEMSNLEPYTFHWETCSDPVIIV